MRYAFTFHIVAWVAGIAVDTLYPTIISTDMLARVASGLAARPTPRQFEHNLIFYGSKLRQANVSPLAFGFPDP